MCLLLAGCVATAVVLCNGTLVRGASEPASLVRSVRWDRQAAADYLDKREVWWQEWPRAQKDHGTICISCHTVVPYVLARPALRQELSQTTIAMPERILIESVEKRVSDWSEVVPFYSDAVNGPGKTVEAHATEAVLNAIILASYDARRGHLRTITRTAFNAAWQLQEEKGERVGGWKWQDFHLAPWESVESGYQGAALLAFEVGNAPDQYASEPIVREHVEQLRAYLRRHYAAQPLINQLYVLWASSKLPGLLTRTERKTLVEAIRNLQQADGGWRLSSLEKWKRIDDTAEPKESDGFATALVALAIEESTASSHDETLKLGLEWLDRHQEKDGNWHASSPNKLRDPESDAGRFMSDAATGYAVLALEEAR
jgi:squalene-hopene/tetraprenyl-beta-curcumene cyclase